MRNSSDRKVAVVIPVYKESLTAYEKISLQQCLSVLGNYPVVLVAPQNLSLNNYQVIVQQDFSVCRFPTLYFRNIGWYSKLLLSKGFYKKFLDYQYILIYQLDCFVFRDDLMEWCSQDYSYIGAPWIQGKAIPPLQYPGMRFINQMVPFFNPKEIFFVGNGGFSLRNVKDSLALIDLFPLITKIWWGHEDSFFSFYGAKSGALKIPNVDTALGFSFETDPEICYLLNNKQLPFGCHAWGKYSIKFWREIFKKLGYSI